MKNQSSLSATFSKFFIPICLAMLFVFGISANAKADCVDYSVINGSLPYVCLGGSANVGITISDCNNCLLKIVSPTNETISYQASEGNGGSLSFDLKHVTLANQGQYITSVEEEGCPTIQGNLNLWLHGPPEETITGAGFYCAGEPGSLIGLQNSSVNYKYQLYRYDDIPTIPVGPAVQGTGGALDFGPIPFGRYCVVVPDSECDYGYARYGDTTISIGNTWTGAVTTAWTTSGNWSCGIIPDENTDVTIPAGVVLHPAISSSIFCRNMYIYSSLTIMKSGTLHLKGN